MKETNGTPQEEASANDGQPAAPAFSPNEYLQERIRNIEGDLPVPRCDYGETACFRVAMRDGARLTTHVYFPEGAGPWPVIVLRNPYIAEGVDVGAMYRLFARYGYAVVYQECRGRGTSEGEWVPFVNERDDGLDTLAWIVKQPWTDGNIGLSGGSYLSFVQLAMADGLPPEVKSLFLMVYGTDQYRLSYMNGMFKHEIFTGWMLGTAALPTDETPEEQRRLALAHKPHVDVDMRLFGRELPWYREWVTQSSPGDPLWKEGVWGRLAQVPGKIGIPVHMTAGWHDIALESAFTIYADLQEDVRHKSRFVVGPWDHSLAPSGDLDYPGHNIMSAGLFREAIEWFDWTLKKEAYAHPLGVLKTYTIGANEWVTRDHWPPEGERTKLHLRAGGGLSDQPSTEAGETDYRYDPADPVPTYGGGAFLPSVPPVPGKPVPGSVLQPAPGYHPGVVSFVSEPLTEDRLIVGSPKVRLSVSSDADDTAFAVKLIEVFPDGRAYNIADGITTLAYRNGAEQPLAYKPGETVDIAIELWPIAWRLRQGSRVRLDVASSNYPAYHLHPNVAGRWAEQTDARVASQTVYCGGAHQSYVELPIARDEGSQS